MEDLPAADRRPGALRGGWSCPARHTQGQPQDKASLSVIYSGSLGAADSGASIRGSMVRDVLQRHGRR